MAVVDVKIGSLVVTIVDGCQSGLLFKVVVESGCQNNCQGSCHHGCRSGLLSKWLSRWLSRWLFRVVVQGGCSSWL